MSEKTTQITNRKAASAAIQRVAQNLNKRGDVNRANELVAIAQFLGGEFLNGAGVGADRAAEGDFHVNLRDGFDPSQDTMPMARRDGEHPHIAPFAKHTPEADTNPAVVHTVSMTLTAPPEVTETDMLNYLLGMREALKVDPSNMQWGKKDQKIQAGIK